MSDLTIVLELDLKLIQQSEPDSIVVRTPGVQGKCIGIIIIEIIQPLLQLDQSILLV